MQFSDIKGFGEKRIEALKSVGIETPSDLITYFPSRYIDTKNLTDLKTAAEGERVIILACMREKPKVAYVKKRLSVVKVKFVYDGANVWCSWFNQPFMAKNIVPERYYYIAGKLKKFKSSFEIVAPQLIKFTGNEPPVIPVYKSIGKVSSALISEAIRAALDAITVDSYIPREIAEKYGLSNLNAAFKSVHFPLSMAEVVNAQRVLSVERLTYMLAAYSIIKAGESDARAHIYKDYGGKLAAAIDKLPYELTAAQKNCIKSIVEGFNSDKRVNVLIEGDVGCGKTVVAFLSMYYAALSGYQSALMCPTEILAFQHYEKAVELLEPLGVRCEFLSGSLNKKARDGVISNIASGMVDCVFGTHAILGDDVNFRALSLVITDEQHRFGVAQRAKLENKSKDTDSIVMSATPIPRTLALTLYGDLKRLVIDELPAKKAKITTRFVPAVREEGMWNYIAAKADAGEQTFVVAPRITDDDEQKSSAEALFEKYSPRFNGSIALLHGKLKDSVKNETMRAFNSGEIKVLVATTVVEVGIDVPNATTMVIYDADRFGLAQLHQLRGRVGRGQIDSFCFVLSGSENEETMNRLNRFISCSDGFALAEYDFKSRGAGDFLGYSQHGAGGAFPSDPEIIELVRQIKTELLSDTAAKSKIEQSISGGKYDFFSGITLN